jgi:alpha-beta hydrolase superfamily lysophospholipase
VTEEALYLEGGGEPFFAVHHVPDAASTDAQAVILVPPFGFEDTATYRARREWALQLGAEGHHVLRLDLPGTGDSPGALADPGRWESWLAAVQRAAAWLRDAAAAPRVAAVGLGSGGYPAFDAVAAGAVDDVVLWATPPQGKRFLRELAAFARMEAQRIAESGGPPSPEPVDGVEAGGHVLPPELVDRIGAVDLTTVPLPATARVLLLDRDGAGAATSLAEALRAAGIDVETAEGRGYAAMVVPPDLSRPPREVFGLVSDWLARGRGAPATRGAAPRDAPAAALEVGAARERHVDVERPGGRLRGILAEPLAAEAPPPLALVFLNAGAIRRTGPNRLWTVAARRWAERGIPSFRVDVEGIGDADGDGEVYQEVGRFHEPHLIDHVTAVLDTLVELGLPPRFVLIGLCSGGHWAFKTALRDDRAAAAVLVNTRILYWHEHLDPARDLRRTRLLVRPVTWKRLLRGDVPVHRWKAFADWAVAGAASRLRRRSADPGVFAWQAATVAEGFSTLRDAGRSAHFVFCDGEPLRDELTAAGLLDRADRWPNVTVTIIPGREHTLKPVWMHRHAERALDDIVRRELALAPATIPEAV